MITDSDEKLGSNKPIDNTHSAPNATV